MSTNAKRKLSNLLADDNKGGPAMKRSKGDGHEGSSTQSKEKSGKGGAGGSTTRTVSPKHLVHIRNAIHAAERLSCSFEVTHSINFILLGEIQLPEPPISATHSGL